MFVSNGQGAQMTRLNVWTAVTLNLLLANVENAWTLLFSYRGELFGQKNT
jgi:hypothetical protein